MQEKNKLTTIDLIKKHLNTIKMHRYKYGGPVVYVKDHCLVDLQIRQSLINQCTTTNMLEAS